LSSQIGAARGALFDRKSRLRYNLGVEDPTKSPYDTGDLYKLITGGCFYPAGTKEVSDGFSALATDS